MERIKGHYELNEETGAIHFVADETEVEEKSAMNVAVGALITAYARVYILSKIREVCGGDKGEISKRFVYIDTDSIHAFADYPKADAYALGGLKLKKKQKGKKHGLPTLALIDAKIDYGQKYLVLCAMNVKGGKVLLPVEKYLATKDRKPTDDGERVVFTNYAGGAYLMEV